MERIVWRYAIEKDVESLEIWQCLSPEDYKKFVRFYNHVHDALGDFSKHVCSDVYTYLKAQWILFSTDALINPREINTYICENLFTNPFFTCFP